MTSAKTIVKRFINRKHPNTGGYYLCQKEELEALIMAVQRDARIGLRKRKGNSDV